MRRAVTVPLEGSGGTWQATSKAAGKRLWIALALLALATGPACSSHGPAGGSDSGRPDGMARDGGGIDFDGAGNDRPAVGRWRRRLCRRCRREEDRRSAVRLRLRLREQFLRRRGSVAAKRARGGCRTCGQTGSEGTCVARSSGANPRTPGDCEAAAASTCSFDGKCDGAGACRKHVSGTVCKAGACDGDAVTGQLVCDGQGNCRPGPTMICSPYSCDPKTNACVAMCSGIQPMRDRSRL